MLPGLLRATLTSLDARNHVVTRRLWERGWGMPLRKDMLLFDRYPIILSLHSSLAFTAVVPISLTRKKISSPMTEVEFESDIARILEQELSPVREKARAFLGKEDLDTVLVDARASHFIIDGREKLATPVGILSVSRIEGALRIIFSSRETFYQISDFFRGGRNPFVTEEGASVASLLEKSAQEKTQMLLLDPSGSASFHTSRERGIHFEKRRFAWDAESSLRALRDAFGVSRTTARHLLEGYRAGECSSHVRQVFERVLAKSASAFFAASAKSRLRGKVHIYSHVFLPFDLPIKKGSAEFLPLDGEALLRTLGFRSSEALAGRPIDLSALAPFLEFYYNESDPTIRRFLRRRIHWIAS